MNKVILLFILNFYLVVVLPLYSQSNEVSLKECIEIALENHPEIKATAEEEKIAIANYKIAQSQNKFLINGEIKTVESLKSVDTETGDNSKFHFPPPNYQIGLYAGPTFQYNLYDPQRSEMVNAARLSIDLSKMNLAKVKQNIIGNVKIGYYGYLFARENRELREQMVNKYRMKLQRAKKLYKTGQRPILDVTKSEVDLTDAKLEYEKAKNNENTMKTELLSSMGIFNNDIKFSPIKVIELPQLRFTIKELNKLSEDYYPDVKIAKMMKEINKFNISVAKSAHNPTVDLMGSLGYLNRNIIDNESINDRGNLRDKFLGDDGYDGWQITTQLGIQAKVSIYSGGAIEAKVDSAKAEYNKSKYIELEILIKMRAMIRNYYHTMSELKRHMELSSLIIDNAKKHLMLAQKSYENGISSQLDIQDAEMAVLKAQLSFLKARYDYLITLAKLSNVVGLGEQYLCLK